MTMFDEPTADIPPGRNPEPETVQVSETSWVVKRCQCGIWYGEEAAFESFAAAHRFMVEMDEHDPRHRRVFKRTEVLCEERGNAGGENP